MMIEIEPEAEYSNKKNHMINREYDSSYKKSKKNLKKGDSALSKEIDPDPEPRLNPS